MAKTTILNLRCCACNDARLKKLSLIYLEGTTKTQNLAMVFYRGFSRRALITSFGTRQSLLARRSSPPKKKSLFLRGLMWFMAGLIFALILHTELTTICVFAVAMSAAAVHIRDAAVYNSKKSLSLYNRWNRSFLCRRCGTITVF